MSTSPFAIAPPPVAASADASADDRPRCAWARTPLEAAYHDAEWGVPVHDDPRLFELLTLEGAQAGLSWLTVLRKRDGYRRAFADFDPARVAEYDGADVERLLADAGIVRHRGKIESAIQNARAVLRIQQEHGSLDAYLWGLAGGVPRVNHPRTLADLPARTPESEAMSRALLARGFRFVGPTTCYAFMQAVGMVDDHTFDCWRRRSGSAG
jgi:DNA-3-methyladenine glycosylase I